MFAQQSSQPKLSEMDYEQTMEVNSRVLDQKQQNIFGRISLFWSVELQKARWWLQGRRVTVRKRNAALIDFTDSVFSFLESFTFRRDLHSWQCWKKRGHKHERWQRRLRQCDHRTRSVKEAGFGHSLWTSPWIFPSDVSPYWLKLFKRKKTCQC